MPEVHPTAIVSPEAELADGVIVGPYATIEAGVKIGPRTRVGTGSCVLSGTTIGEENEIHMYAGGAIVADSEAQAEHQEVLAKARGMFEATGCRHGALSSERELAAT